jgi:C4-dicarboxylate transporter/malic acid transport protein
MFERHPIKYFSPAWFAVVMGTGGLANTLYLWGENMFPGGILPGEALAFLADILYFIVLVPWLLRWALYFKYVRRDLHHPITTNFFVTMPVATVIVGTNIYLIWAKYLSEVLTFHIIFLAWLISILGVNFFSFYTTFRVISAEDCPKPELINFSWIMAPIANMAVLLIGNPVLSMAFKYKSSWAISILVVNSSLLGIGFFLFIFISATIFVRLIQHPLPPSELTPSFGILLSAIGLTVSAVVDTARNAKNLGLLSTIALPNLAALIIWGFGFWIIGIIILISIYQIRRGGIPFALGWWAYIFPLAAYTGASQKITSAFPAYLTYSYTTSLTILLALLWLYTSWNTVLGVLSARLFCGTPIE